MSYKHDYSIAHLSNHQLENQLKAIKRMLWSYTILCDYDIVIQILTFPSIPSLYKIPTGMI